MALTTSHYTPLLVEQMVRLGASLPFRQAAAMFAAFFMVKLAHQTVARQTEAAGVRYCAVQEDEARAEQTAPAAGPQVGLLSVDGCMVPLVKGQWAEVRTLVVGEVGRKRQADGRDVAHGVNLSYFSRLHNAASFEQAVWPELLRRGIPQAKTVVAVNDGAEWIQSLLDLNCVQAVRILDFTHASQYLSAAGQAALGEGSAAYQAWYEQQCHELKHGDAAAVVSAVEQLGNAAAVNTARHYLGKRVAMMQYAQYQQLGYPIGSGCVESANKLVVEARMKGAGMHWAGQNVNAMLALRNALCSEQWAAAWQGVVGSQGVVQRQRRVKASAPQEEEERAVVAPESRKRVAPAAAQLLQPSANPTTAAQAKERWKPAPDHPWRGRGVGKAAPLRRLNLAKNL